jgi:hypothetical protein
VSYYKADDRETNPDGRSAAETQEIIGRLTLGMEALQPQGCIAISPGVAIEDGARGVYLVGWRSVEVRPFAHALSPLSSLAFQSFQRAEPFFFSFLTTGPHAFWHVR